MIGRAAIGYPWIFREIKHFISTGEKLSHQPEPHRTRASHARKHLEFSIKWKGTEAWRL